MNVLVYWNNNKLVYPTLATIAQRVLCIPATNTSVERLFSDSRNTITSRCTRLQTNLTELFIPAKSITNEQLSTYCETLSYLATDFKHALHSDIHRISYDLLNNEQCESFSGLTKHQMQQLATEYNLNEENIFLFYTKCNTDNSDLLLSEVFGISQRSVSRHFNQSIEDLFNSLFMDQMDPITWDRKKVDIYTPMFAKELLQYLPRYTPSKIKSISTGFYAMKLSKRYFTNFIDHTKIYKHQTIENCIKVVRISSRFVSGVKHCLIFKFYPEKSEDTKFYCSCKSGARTTNPCTHALRALILIQFIQKQLLHLKFAKTNINYRDAIKI
ncbi:unnamed protein product [Rotaria sp. Silwood2]|nr:unnamed protein product [Rotaria sp. Silwood2]